MHCVSVSNIRQTQVGHAPLITSNTPTTTWILTPPPHYQLPNAYHNSISGLSSTNQNHPCIRRPSYFSYIHNTTLIVTSCLLLFSPSSPEEGKRSQQFHAYRYSYIHYTCFHNFIRMHVFPEISMSPKCILVDVSYARLARVSCFATSILQHFIAISTHMLVLSSVWKFS